MSILLLPKKQYVPCGYCPQKIYKDMEANGRLYLLQGKPICARCRILKGSKMRFRILYDKGNLKKDLILRESILQKQENKRINEVALKSQQQFYGS